MARTAGITVAEDLADARPITGKADGACGCALEDHIFHLESCSPSVTPANKKISRRQSIKLPTRII